MFFILECLKNFFSKHMQSESLYVMMLNANLKSICCHVNHRKILFYFFYVIIFRIASHIHRDKHNYCVL